LVRFSKSLLNKTVRACLPGFCELSSNNDFLMS
jgi:hypothetical protein